MPGHKGYQLIEEGKKIVVAHTGREYDGMYGLGTPEDLAFFKVTSVFDRGCLDDTAKMAGRELIEALTRLYAGFFDVRNLAGVSALLHDDFALEDPSVKQIGGKKMVIAYIKDIFDTNPDLRFEVRNVIVDDTKSVIEFKLRIGGKQLKGIDVIEWQGRKMAELRAYL